MHPYRAQPRRGGFLGTPPRISAPGAPADALRPAPPAGNAGSRGPGRHGAARGATGGNSPGTTGGAGPEAPAVRTGGAPPAAVPPLGSAQRLNPVRPPAGPSGHPPWGPAEKPASELPWMDAPGSGQGRLGPPRRAFPVGAQGPAGGPMATGVDTSGLGAGGLGAGGLGAGGLGAGGLGVCVLCVPMVWVPMVGADGPGAGRTGAGQPLAGGRPADQQPMTDSGLVRRRPKSQSPFPDLAGPPPGIDSSPGSQSGDDAEGTKRPMYSWNPSDTTEAFPAVPPPGDSRPG